MNLQKAEQVIVNATYAAMAWLILDFGLLFQQHGDQTFSILASHPEMTAGAIITIACIAGLIYKSRLAAMVLFLLLLLAMLIRTVQGIFPSAMMMIFFIILLYFFFTGILGTIRYHHLKSLEQDSNRQD
ncbi:MAG: hypothetical protein KZQ78_00780 [Candidatus Thiodiazotropha sp. (ex Ustalcina ferruginea)]|nr:hypothetical protein [Candidatus Thiodiazotropha sp. (ex Ustalcina ferruginea)]